MKHRWIALLLALCLCFGMVGSAAAETDLSDAVDIDTLVEAGKHMYSTFEGGYDNVVKNDVGAVGMGIMGWRGVKALELLKLCCTKAPSYAKSTLGTSLYNEVVNTPLWTASSGSAWQKRTFNDTEAAAAKTLISSKIGKDAQNELARSDITTQVQHGWNAGVRTEAALLYYCSAENHYGPGGVKGFMRSVRKALALTDDELITSLDQFHKGAVKAGVSTLSYRFKIYNFIKYTLKWDTTGKHDNCPSALFADVPPYTNWAHAGIDFVVSRGLFAGTSETTFSPMETMNRAMMVTVLYRLAGSPAVSGSCGFQDVIRGSYYEKPVIWATKHNIVSGVSDTAFDPMGDVTREQIAAILFRFAQEMGVAGSLRATELTGYKDVDQVHDFAYYAMIWATEHGLIQGDDAGYLKPRDPAIRAQVAAIYMRYVNEFG